MTALESWCTPSSAPTRATANSSPTSSATRSETRADVMPRRPHLLLAGLISICLLLTVPAGAQPEPGIAYSIELDGEISPATEAWIVSALDSAADEGAEIAIIRLDTPGGLDDSTREIVKDITAAPMPVVVY